MSSRSRQMQNFRPSQLHPFKADLSRPVAAAVVRRRRNRIRGRVRHAEPPLGRESSHHPSERRCQGLQEGNSIRNTVQDVSGCGEIHLPYGLRFIWIDSLCIIQDSQDDWLHESSRMGDVYRNSVLTIAASTAAEGGGGLYTDRDPL